MLRWINIARTFALLVAVPTTLLALWHLAGTATGYAGTFRWADIAVEIPACAALLLVNAGLLIPSSRAANGGSFVAAVVAPLAAGVFYVGTVDPVALLLGLPLLVPTVAVLGAGATFAGRGQRIRA